MSPPTATADIWLGGSTAPSKNDLLRLARLVLDNCGISFGTRHLIKLVDTFTKRAPNADGRIFFQYLAAKVQLSETQRRAALSNPDIARAISYADPTGEAAVNNVLRSR